MFCNLVALKCTERLKKTLPLQQYLIQFWKFILLNCTSAHSEAPKMIGDVDQPHQSMEMLFDQELAKNLYIFQEPS